MVGLTFLIALVALIIAVMAYRRTTAPRELETQMDALRDKTADALSRMEKSVRREEKSDIVETSGS